MEREASDRQRMEDFWNGLAIRLRIKRRARGELLSRSEVGGIGGGGVDDERRHVMLHGMLSMSTHREVDVVRASYTPVERVGSTVYSAQHTSRCHKGGSCTGLDWVPDATPTRKLPAIAVDKGNQINRRRVHQSLEMSLVWMSIDCPCRSLLCLSLRPTSRSHPALPQSATVLMTNPPHLGSRAVVNRLWWH